MYICADFSGLNFTLQFSDQVSSRTKSSLMAQHGDEREFPVQLMSYKRVSSAKRAHVDCKPTWRSMKKIMNGRGPRTEP